MLRRHVHKNAVMQDDYNKFGEDAFEFRVVGTYEDLEASRMEMFMMYVLRTRDDSFGYNQLDRHGTGKGAIACKLRLLPRYWNYPGKSILKGRKMS